MKKSKKYLEKGGKMEEIKDLWKKVGLISYLTKKFNQIKAQFGKTAMMKYLYILQEVYNRLDPPLLENFCVELSLL